MGFWSFTYEILAPVFFCILAFTLVTQLQFLSKIAHPRQYLWIFPYYVLYAVLTLVYIFVLNDIIFLGLKLVQKDSFSGVSTLFVWLLSQPITLLLLFLGVFFHRHQWPMKLFVRFALLVILAFFVALFLLLQLNSWLGLI